ncbi:MAG TPA: AIPR family protein [Waterburya sp.]|jgi:hypothetical protein
MVRCEITTQLELWNGKIDVMGKNWVNCMNYINAFKSNTNLIQKFGEGNAYLAWSMALYLDYPDAEQLATDSLTDDGNDKKIDFIRLDWDLKRIVFAQGYYSSKKVDSAPSNKASDLNTASAWFMSGDMNEVPEKLKAIVIDCRKALEAGDVEQIDLLYVHNLPESVNVSKELTTAAVHLERSLPSGSNIKVFARELGIEGLERLYSAQESSIAVKESVECPAKVQFTEDGPFWKAAILSVPGTWLRDIFTKYSDDLFSANYRGFLGITKRRKINTGIRQSAENDPSNFWVFNNGITILTLGFDENKRTGKTTLQGISVINGAQTTGSIGSVDITKHDLKNVKVLCRIIECSDANTISQIVKYNNTQNEITTWDQYSNSPEQKRIAGEFQAFGHEYSLKRGFSSSSIQLGIEQVIQPLLAFAGDYASASRGKNSLFERRSSYEQAFKDKKARHILFIHTLAKAIDERKIELKRKQTEGTIVSFEEKQLSLFRNLRFKTFLIAVVAECLESIIGDRVDLSQVAFKPDPSKITNKSINDLVALWLPIVTNVLAYVTSVINKDLSEIMLEDNALKNISSQVSTGIYATQATNPNPVLTSFKNFVSPKG